MTDIKRTKTIPPKDRVMCGCGNRKIAIFGETKCAQCRHSDNYVSVSVAPLCTLCNRAKVRSLNHTKCSACRRKERAAKPKGEQTLCTNCHRVRVYRDDTTLCSVCRPKDEWKSSSKPGVFRLQREQLTRQNLQEQSYDRIQKYWHTLFEEKR